jgi:hypothetical protein
MMMRTLSGFLKCLSSIEAGEFSWKSVLEETLARVHRINGFAPSKADSVTIGANSGASNLFISIVEAGEEIVSLEMPARSIENLSDLVPEHVHEKLVSLGYDLDGMRDKAIANNLVKQILFDAEVGARKIKAWLG